MELLLLTIKSLEKEKIDTWRRICPQHNLPRVHGQRQPNTAEKAERQKSINCALVFCFVLLNSDCQFRPNHSRWGPIYRFATAQILTDRKSEVQAACCMTCVPVEVFWGWGVYKRLAPYHPVGPQASACRRGAQSW